MTLFPGPQCSGLRYKVQAFLLRISFALQDVGDCLQRQGRRFEDWVCPSGRRALREPDEEYWKLP